MIMIALSMKPNPMKGTAEASATMYSCCLPAARRGGAR